MKSAIAFVFVTALAISPAAAWDCANKSNVQASTPVPPVSTPVQTAEAPSPTTTK
jgi:hypothetical protein